MILFSSVLLNKVSKKLKEEKGGFVIIKGFVQNRSAKKIMKGILISTKEEINN